jgi:hypothetical protein
LKALAPKDMDACTFLQVCAPRGHIFFDGSDHDIFRRVHAVYKFKHLRPGEEERKDEKEKVGEV